MRRLWRNPLAREISLVLLFKLAFILGLWFTFFRHPVEGRLASDNLGRVVLGDVSSVPAPSKE